MICLSVALAASCGSAQAANQSRPLAETIAWSWTSFYLGGHIGAGFGTAKVDDPYGPTIYGDTVRLPKALAGVQGGYNWQAPSSAWVIGIEADASAVDADGTDTCLAYSGQFVSANCRVRERVLGSITGRIGYAFGQQARSLAYLKGGAAFLAGDVAVTTNSGPYLNQPATIFDQTRWGWTIGAGVEHALSSGWAVRAEYDYADFGSRWITTPTGGLLQIPNDRTSLVDTPGAPTRVRQDTHLVKLGLNYYFGHGDDGAALLPITAPSASIWSPWQVEIGGRYWYSRGRYQNDLAMTTNKATQEHLVSRLTYQSDGHSGEAFWRIDGPHRVFVKGFAGGGGLVSGKMNDEDWVPTDANPAAYSNTYHGKVTGSIAYATLDAGVDLFGDASGKFGVFAGYNFYRDRKDSFGCQQIALVGARGYCSVPFPPDQLAISENEDWHSLRIGANGSVSVAPGAKLVVDAAYLPYTHISALDIHHNRTEMPSPNSPAWGTGRGVQLEAILTYDVTPAFNIGVGGRYWAMWATDVLTAGFGSAVATEALPIRVERYGTFLQASYKFGR